MGDILDAYYRGGEAAALDALSDAMAREYLGDAQYGWHLEVECQGRDQAAAAAMTLITTTRIAGGITDAP